MKDRRGFTLVELMVVMAVIAVLVAILLPAIQRVRANARAASSKNNLAQMGEAMKHYEGQGLGNLRQNDWLNRLLPYLDGSEEVFLDPADTNGLPSYALSNKVARFGSGDDAKIAIIESDDATVTASCNGGAPEFDGEVAYRHFSQTHALLYGGSVRAFAREEIDPADASHEPLVKWWLPYDEHKNVCGTVVSITNPNPLPGPSSGGGDSDIDLVPDTPPEEPPEGNLCVSNPTNGWTAGLMGEYRTGVENFTGTPDACRVDEDLFYPYGTGDACEANDKGGKKIYWFPGGVNYTSVVWTGQIRADYTEEYQFHLSYDDGTTLIIDGATVFSHTGHVFSNCIVPVGSPVAMTAGQWVDIELSNSNHSGPGQVRLQWESASVPLADVPASAFRTAAP